MKKGPPRAVVLALDESAGPVVPDSHVRQRTLGYVPLYVDPATGDQFVDPADVHWHFGRKLLSGETLAVTVKP